MTSGMHWSRNDELDDEAMYYKLFMINTSKDWVKTAPHAESNYDQGMERECTKQ